MFNVAAVTRSIATHYPYGVMDMAFEKEVPVGLLSGLDYSKTEDMIIALERIKKCGNSKITYSIEHDQYVLDNTPGLKEIADRGGFTGTLDIDSYLASLKSDMEVE